MEIVGLKLDLEEIKTYAYSIQARGKLDMDDWQIFTGTASYRKERPLSFWQDHVDAYFQHMDYNYLLTERIECYGIDEKGNRQDLEPVVINETCFWLNKKEVVIHDED